MSNAIQFNAITGNRMSGHNAELLIEAKQEMGFSENRWVTYKQAKEAGLKTNPKLGQKGLRGRSTGLRGFEKKGKNRTQPFWFRVFNLSDFDPKSFPESLKKKANNPIAKIAKKAKKGTVTSPKSKKSEVTYDGSFPAIPVPGKDGYFILRDTDGNLHEVEVKAS